MLPVDFGSNLRESKVTVPENGVIYSEKDVVIKGIPKNISIISAKNVFVAGDFNQGADRVPLMAMVSMAFSRGLR